MITSKDITFICHVRIDNHLRSKNIRVIYNFYKRYAPGCRFIFVEDDTHTRLTDTIKLDTGDKYHLFKNHYQHRKTESYNIGASLCETDIMIFLDVDIIVDCIKLLESINFAIGANTLDCLIGYSGVAFYFNHIGEDPFINTLSISDLTNRVANLSLANGSSNAFAVVGNIKAVGGCLVMTRKAFNRINGFNPFFIGWGYEDNEVVSRAHKLGLCVYKSNIANHHLYHLPHEVVAADKSMHPRYKSNTAIIQYVESLDINHLEQYKNQW